MFLIQLIYETFMLYVTIGICLSIFHCFGILYVINYVDDKKDITITDIINQTLTCVFEWPSILYTFLNKNK